MDLDKHRIRFRKSGDLRLVSHHDLMRSLERLLRRAALPFRSTEGFHPTPRMIFALSLPLGVIGEAEVVEIEWTQPLEPDFVLEQLRSQAPSGMEFLSAKRIPIKTTARPRRSLYRFPLRGVEPATVAQRCQDLCNQTACWVDRYKPRRRRVNIRPFLRQLHVIDQSVEMDLWVAQEGTARAEEVLKVLGLGDRLDAGDVIIRTDLRLHDELSAEEAAEGPNLSGVPLSVDLPADSTNEQPEHEEAHAEWGASPNGPVVE